MGRRLDLHNILTSITPNVYFQPPATLHVDHPCIIYQRNSALTEFADNEPYHYQKSYEVIVVDRDPDSEIPDKVAMLPMCVFNRFFTADNLNHDVFDIYF